MYSGYSTATLTLIRAKSSLSSTQLSLLNDRAVDRSVDFPIYGLTINPRFLYGYYQRHSALVQWIPSRSFLSVGSRYRRLALHEGYYSETIGLLADFECSRRSELSHSGKCSECEAGINVNSGERKCSLRKEGTFGSSSSSTKEGTFGSRSSSRKEGTFGSSSSSIKEGTFGSRSSSRKEGTFGSSSSRKEGAFGSSPSYYSTITSSLSGDSEPKRENRRRVVVGGECSNAIRRYDDEEANSIKKEVRQIYDKDGSRAKGEFEFRESNGGVKGSSSRKVYGRDVWDQKEDVSSIRRARESNERYIRVGRRVVEQRGSKEGSEELRVTSKVIKDDGNRGSSFKNVVGARIGSGQGRDTDQHALRGSGMRSSEDLNETSELRIGNIQRGSYSNSNFEGKITKERVDGTTSIQSSVVARDKKLQVESKKQNGNQIHASETEKMSSSSQRVFERRSDEQKHRSTSAVNLVQGARGQQDQTNQHDRFNSSSVTLVDESTSNQNSVVARDQRLQVEQQAVDKVEPKKQNGNQIHTSDTEKMSSSTSQRVFERRTDDRQHHSTSVVNLVQGVREQQDQTNQNDRYSSNIIITSTELEGISHSQEVSNSRIQHTDHSTSVTDLVHGSREKEHLTNIHIHRPYNSRISSEMDSKLSESSRSKVERVSDYQGISISMTGNQRESSSSSLVHGKKDKHESIIRAKSIQSEKKQKAITGIYEGSSRSSSTHIQEVDDQARRDESYQIEDGKLESASRLEKSSALYIGEFVENLRQEASKNSAELDNTTNHPSKIRSETEDRVIDTTTGYTDDEYIQQITRQSSSASGRKGPSDEIWDVTTKIMDEPEASGAFESTTTPARTEISITRSERRSLWSYIADIIRTGWVRAESKNSTSKSVTRGSSHESISSEGWFSGHEPDETYEEIDKKGVNFPNEPSHQVTHPIPIKESLEAVIHVVPMAPSEVSSSTSSGINKRNPSSEGVSPLSKPEKLLWAEGENVRQGIPFSVVSVHQSSESTADKVIPIIEEEITETVNARAPVRDELPEVGPSEGNQGELKRRKFQRNKQVLREQFNEWEEAYKQEREQRMMDEFYMREALLEAKKAADTWEVPVGAVLVQNGKIIARGCNLVEELRDSTAHSEMICIREASTLLRTWRLADTTLYVTLEPCAMCAGAILQARIDTVVWGAPNKLLGADGSWVRLFPGEAGGSSDLNPTVGPVHPFHPKITIRPGVLSAECSDAMQNFFQLRRKKKKNRPPSPPPPSCLPVSTHPVKLLTKVHDMFTMMFCL